MNKKASLFFIVYILFNSFVPYDNLSAQYLPKDRTMSAMVLANKYFMEKWPDAGKTIITERERPSNIWTRGTYYEGLMALYEISPDPEYLKYALIWGEFHKWGLRNGIAAWNGLATESLHTNGFLGYVQGTGKQPSDSQPVGYDTVPNFEDFGLGCFLLAGSEVYKLE